MKDKHPGQEIRQERQACRTGSQTGKKSMQNRKSGRKDMHAGKEVRQEIHVCRTGSSRREISSNS